MPPAATRGSKRVPIRYRECLDQTGGLGGHTLESALREATRVREGAALIGQRWAKRIMRDAAENRQCMVANHLRDGGTYLFGNLVEYEVGRSQPLISEEADAQEASIAQMPPPNQRQFLSSMMFWMVTDNHVFVLQHGTLRPAELEVYLRWLLVERTSICAQTLQVVLGDMIDLGAAGIAENDVKAVRIGGRAQAGAVEAAAVRQHEPHEGTTTRRESRRLARMLQRNWAAEVVRLICGDDREARQIMDHVPEGVDLSVNLEIGFDTRKQISRAALKEIAVATRNLPDADIELETKSGVIKQGDKIRLVHTQAVATVGDLLDRDSVLDAMIAAYAKFVQSGRIQPSSLGPAD